MLALILMSPCVLIGSVATGVAFEEAAINVNVDSDSSIIAASILISLPASRIKLPASLLELSTISLTVMSLCACSSTFPPFKAAANSPALMIEVPVTSTEKATTCPGSFSGSSGSISLPVRPPEISIFSGSNNSVPISPFFALKSVTPRYAKNSLPDTSAKPPSPLNSPPKAMISPLNTVAPSAHKITRPPSPFSVALALITTSTSTWVSLAFWMAAFLPW